MPSVSLYQNGSTKFIAYHSRTISVQECYHLIMVRLYSIPVYESNNFHENSMANLSFQDFILKNSWHVEIKKIDSKTPNDWSLKETPDPHQFF